MQLYKEHKCASAHIELIIKWTQKVRDVEHTSISGYSET